MASHSLTYQVVEGWGQLPEGWEFTQVAGVAVDSQDRIYVYNRGEHPMIVFDRDGNMLNTWGEGFLKHAHGIFIDKTDMIYLVGPVVACSIEIYTGGRASDDARHT